MSGQLIQIDSECEDGWTSVYHTFHAADHLLLSLWPVTKRQSAGNRRAIKATAGNTSAGGSSEPAPSSPTSSRSSGEEVARLGGRMRVTLSEPNVLLLDQAEWRIDGRDWQPSEEILRLDNAARSQLNLPARGGRMAQPWADTAPAPVLAHLQLKFIICSDIPLERPLLALETPQTTQIHLDRHVVSNVPVGWWVDESIKTIQLPPLSPGTHELVLTIPFTRTTNVEWCYLLGDFGVVVAGRSARIVAPVRVLSFGDWTSQGLPFYAGNVTYHCMINADGGRMLLEAAKFKNPLLSVDLDGKLAGKIAFPPYQLHLGTIEGEHALDLTAFGNRVNAFGAVHNADENLSWFGPAAWRQTGANWSYEYQLRPMGILSAPIIRRAH
jgi:hypothetical protein